MVRHVAALALAIALASVVPAPAQQQQTEPGNSGFAPFLKELWPDAEAKGISRATFDAAFGGQVPDPRVIALVHRQPEFRKPMGAYIGSMVSPANIATGRRKAAAWSQVLDAVEKKFGVERWIILAIWGLESSYGAEKDRWDIYRSLATLAQARYRDPYFRNELLVALRIMENGHIGRSNRTGSWAGAMGQTQFMPSNFMDYAIDFSGDGRPDIWTNVPDVLGSTGNYLHKGGWKPGVTWGFEVALPKGFDYRRSRGSHAEWTSIGIRRADGGALPPSGEGILFFPSGAAGPAFLATENYPVLKEYNNSDAYVLSVGHLADRLRGQGPIVAPWPKDEVSLSRDKRIAMQRKLAQLGYNVRDFEGHIDFDLQDIIREVQLKFDMLPDGYPTAALLDRLDVR